MDAVAEIPLSGELASSSGGTLAVIDTVLRDFSGHLPEIMGAILVLA
jgi:hypothetical protein